MKIAIVTDKSREGFLPTEEALLEDKQKEETVENLKNVLSKKYDCISIIADDNIIQNLRNEKVDLIFNLCNGLEGDSKLAQLPALFEFLNIPYTGSSVLGHGLAINKNYSSTIFKSSTIPTPRFYPIYNIEEIEDVDLEFPILIKPNDEGSSRGIHQDSLVFNKEDLYKKVKEELSIYNPPIILNEYIVGKEFSVGVVGNGDEIEVLPIQELDFIDLPKDLHKFYSFEVKSYYKSQMVYHLPARLNEEEREIIKSTAKKAFNSLGLKDYARVDIILKEGIPYVLEINSLPGLAKGKSSLYRMAEASEYKYDGLVFQIIETAKKRYNLSKIYID